MQITSVLEVENKSSVEVIYIKNIANGSSSASWLLSSHILLLHGEWRFVIMSLPDSATALWYVSHYIFPRPFISTTLH